MLDSLKNKGVIKTQFEKRVKPHQLTNQPPSSQEDWSQEWEPHCPFDIEQLELERDILADVNAGCFDKSEVPLIEIPDDPPREVHEDDWGQGLNDTQDDDEYFSDSQRTLYMNDFHSDDDSAGQEVSQPVMLGQGSSAGSSAGTGKLRRSNASLF